MGAVVPLGAVGTTGVGLDHETGAAVGWDPEDALVPEGDEPVVVGVEEPAAGAFGSDAEPAASVVGDTPLPVVEEEPAGPVTSTP